MKIQVTKINAARSQLIEAINLFFEERDPVSIHTLVGASLQILNDHITDIGVVWDNNLILRYDSIYVNDAYRKLWHNIINEPRNFFKHADKDLEKGKLSIEFETERNEIHLLEAIRCLTIVEGKEFIFSIEFIFFFLWLGSKNPNLIKKEERDFFKNIPGIDALSVTCLKDWKKAIDLANIHQRNPGTLRLSNK